MRFEYVRVTSTDNTPLYFVWNHSIQSFEKHNGNDRWPNFSAFISDVKLGLTAKGINFGGQHEELGDKIIAMHSRDVPHYFNHADTPKSKANGSGILGKTATVVFFCGIVYMMGYTIWDTAIRPALGGLGLIEYKSKTQIRYERFLSRVSNCQEKKKVFSEASSTYPVFHLFECPGGKEEIWAYKIEIVSKTKESKWVLE